MRGHLAAASCLLALSGVAACGVPAPSSAAGPTPGESSAVVVERAGPSRLTFGQPHRFADGLSVQVSEPKAFDPSKAAYPRARRGIAFQILLRNDTERLYRVTDMAILVSADGDPADQIVDPAQGFTGISEADTDLLPHGSVLVTLAYAVPEGSSALTLTLQPDLTASSAVFYAGRA